jgi:hypothetical protein
MHFASFRSMPRSLAKTITPIALAGATLGLAANPAQALTQFAGDYAPANWTHKAFRAMALSTQAAPQPAFPYLAPMIIRGPIRTPISRSQHRQREP